MTKRRRRSLGFTLLEMLLAVTVIAVAGIAISRAVGGVAGQSYSLERRTMAHWVAQNQVNRLRIARQTQTDEVTGDRPPLPEGKDSVRLFMGDRDWEVRTQIIGTDHPEMRRAEVKVYELIEGEAVGPVDQLVTFLGTH